MTKKIREKLGLSQRAFAELIHVRQATISHIESGRAKPSPMLQLILSLIGKGVLTIKVLEKFKTNN